MNEGAYNLYPGGNRAGLAAASADHITVQSAQGTQQPERRNKDHLFDAGALMW